MPRKTTKKENHNSDFTYTSHPMLQAEFDKIFPKGRTEEYSKPYHAHIVLDNKTGLYLLTVYPGKPHYDTKETTAPLPYVLVYDERHGKGVAVADLSVDEFETFRKKLDWRDERYSDLNLADHPARYKHVLANFDLEFFTDGDMAMEDEIWSLQDDLDQFIDHCEECQRQKKLNGEKKECTIDDQNLCAIFWNFKKLREKE